MNPFEIPEYIERYLEDHSSPEDPVLQELNRYTHLNTPYPQMLSGPVLGKLLQLFSELVRPSRILEIGTFTGYSAICLARGLEKGGTLITLDINDELKEISLHFFRKAGLAEKIDARTGDAREIIPALSPPFDLVFIDAHKDDYPDYYDLVIDKVRKGGWILADNALWGGKVAADPNADSATRALDRFNREVTVDPRVENLLLPVRDGIMVIKKL